MNPTSISWVLGPDGKPGFTWNPFAGCSATPISKGCDHCWAAGLASTRLAHLPAYKGLAKDGRWTGEMRFFPEKLAEPLKRRAPAGIFAGDMGDIALLPFEQIAAIFGVMAARPQHRFYLLTKGPGRMREWFAWFDGIVARSPDVDRWMILDEYAGDQLESACLGEVGEGDDMVRIPEDSQWPLPNVWIGASLCLQDDAEVIVKESLQIPAAKHFLSMEPLLGEVDLTTVNDGSWYDREGAQLYDALRGIAYYRDGEHGLGGGPKVDWVIVGGESGPKARPCRVEHIRSIVSQCRQAGVACWVKQMGTEAGIEETTRVGNHEYRDEYTRNCGAWPADSEKGEREAWILRMRDRSGADPAEWPDDLRVRQTPEGTR